MSDPSTTTVATQEVPDHAKSTLFVRGLPYDATSKDLEAFFSDVGPIRKCFVVTEQRGEDGIKEGEPGFKNKGFGYVHYAMADDAQQALKKLSSVKFKGGRKLRMELARRRKETTNEHTAKYPNEKILPAKRKAPTKATKATEGAPSSGNDNKAARLIVRNLPWKYHEAELKKVFGAKGTVTDVQLPKNPETGRLRGFAFIQYENVDEAGAVSIQCRRTRNLGVHLTHFSFLLCYRLRQWKL